MMTIFEELDSRGLITSMTGTKKTLEQAFNDNNTKFYCGFDPTADSLHVGHLLPLNVLSKLADSGYDAYALIGGATGMIGDPTGRTSGRPMLNEDTIEENTLNITDQILSFNPKIRVANNLSWWNGMPFIEAMRRFGGSFKISDMIARQHVQSRLGNGLTLPEFTYIFMQAVDFLMMRKHLRVNVQFGGSDQWCNMVEGVSLIKDCFGKETHAFTLPLLTRDDGTKFGKSDTDKVIWLDKDKTSSYDFYQFFYNLSETELRKVDNFSLCHSLTSVDVTGKDLQQRVANSQTITVHGHEEWSKVNNINKVLFSDQGIRTMEFTKEIMEELDNHMVHIMYEKSMMPSLSLIDVLVKTNLSSSKSEARRDIEGLGICINNLKEVDITRMLQPEDLLEKVDKPTLFLRKGKNKFAKVSFY